jgi:hypothetical protein
MNTLSQNEELDFHLFPMHYVKIKRKDSFISTSPTRRLSNKGVKRRDSTKTSSTRELLTEDDNDRTSQPSPTPSTKTALSPTNLSTLDQLNLWAYLYNQNPTHDPHFADPKCNKCGKRTKLQITREGRPCYRCVARHRDSFSCFADLVGCDEENPSCLCGQPSRVNVNGVGVVYYTCVTGGCELFRFKR